MSLEYLKKVTSSPGLLISLIIILTPALAWTIQYDFSGLSNLEIAGTSLKRSAGFAGMAMFAWTLILSGRYKLLDNLFQGLDQTYIVHRFFGTVVMIALLLHPFGYTLLYLAEFGTVGLLQHFFGYENLAVTLGRVSLYGLLLVGAWSILTRAKHETFIAIHRWLGLLFIIGAIHAFMSGPESVLANDPFMWWYMLILSGLATLTYIHYTVLGDILHPYYKYRVQSVDILPGGVNDIVLTPKYRSANFRPGQFFYVAFDDIDPDDYHPYSVASGNENTQMRFLIKQLGDHTTQLQYVEPGTTARLKGSYGAFTFDDRNHPKQLWVTGGIGVTPFLSKAYSLRHSKLSPHITMFHFAKTEDEAIDRDQLRELKRTHRGFDYKCLPEDKFGIISLHDIAAQIGPLDEYAIYMCGPPGMLKAYEEQARELGLQHQLYFEEFGY